MRVYTEKIEDYKQLEEKSNGLVVRAKKDGRVPASIQTMRVDDGFVVIVIGVVRKARGPGIMRAKGRPQ